MIRYTERCAANPYDHKGSRGNQYRLDAFRRHDREGFCFGGIESMSYGVYITGVQVGDAPKRDVSFVQIPGRDGDLMIDNKRWHNVTITYHCAIVASFSERFDQFKNALLAKNGYHKLHDSIYPNIYRMAALVDGIKPNAFRLNQSGTFDIVFTCKPQRYDIFDSDWDHDIKQTPGQYYNFAHFTSRPIITIYGTGAGTLTIGNRTVDILNIDEELTLDCDTMNAFRQIGDAPAENKNNDIYAPEFPVLEPGTNEISWTGDITSITIRPRGWKL